MSEESESSSSSSSEEEYLPEVNEEFEKSFFKTLSSLKNNDPSIYDQDKKFFDESTTVIPVKSNKNTMKEKPLFLKDYERKCIAENEGYDENREDSETVNSENNLPYAIEQRKLKESFKSFLKDSDDDEDANLLKPCEKSAVEAEKEDAEYIQWLKGQKKELEDKVTEENLKNLRDYWNSDNLGEDEAFLRDYILNKKFIDKDEFEDDDDGELTEDSETFEAQENFEQEYNLRYETGDNLIRRFPRNVDGSLRRKDNKRSKKRAEIKERKELDKKKKREEINRQKKLKVKEIAERLEKLKELTGNEKLAFNDDDILNDFDPAEHDRKMSEMYNEDFYNEEDCDKPDFNDLDLGDVEIDGIDQEQHNNIIEEADNEETSRSRKEKKKTRTKKKKERKKKAFSDISTLENPVYDPKLHESYQKYMDEYYQLDCEDFIEDIPCRFKYKQVEPNDFGLSVEEILSADDKELNRWSSIKKIYKIRPPHVEKNEAKMYKLKGQNESLKQKILPSLFKTEQDECEKDESSSGVHKVGKSKKSKKKNSSEASALIHNTEMLSENENISGQPIETNECLNDGTTSNPQETNKKSKKRKRKSEDISDPNSVAEPLGEPASSQDINMESQDIEHPDPKSVKHQTKPFKKIPKFNRNDKFKKNHNKGARFNKNHNFHDSRLSAYGINPKKFKCKS